MEKLFCFTLILLTAASISAGASGLDQKASGRLLNACSLSSPDEQLVCWIKFRDKGGMAAFKRIKAERLHDPAFALRKVSIQSAITATMAQVTITDEGPGFDYNALIDPTSPDCIDKPHGRGIFLIKQIFDEVRFNHSGNSITLVLRKNSP